ncbi:hypothetical protein ACP0J1_30755, partial [Pseudomonas aeruginosa]
YGWWIGGGKPVSSCCPFCLSESWDSTTTGIGWRLLAYVSIAVGLGMIFYSIKLILASIMLIGGGVWVLANISTIRFFSMKQLLSLFFGRDA